MIILSIDQSLTSSGVTLCEGSFENRHTYSIVPKKMRGVDRLIYIREYIRTVVNTSKVELVILEEYGFSARGKVFSLGELGGILRVLCKDLNVPFLVIPIGTHKMYTTGKGNTKKEMMMLELFKRYNIDSKNNDEADSISMMLTTMGLIAHSKGEEDSVLKCPFKECQLRAIKSLESHLKEEQPEVLEFICR